MYKLGKKFSMKVYYFKYFFLLHTSYILHICIIPLYRFEGRILKGKKLYHINLIKYLDFHVNLGRLEFFLQLFGVFPISISEWLVVLDGIF